MFDPLLKTCSPKLVQGQRFRELSYHVVPLHASLRRPRSHWPGPLRQSIETLDSRLYMLQSLGLRMRDPGSQVGEKAQPAA